MNLSTLLALSGSVAVLLAAPALLPEDHTTLPPSAAEVHAVLSANQPLGKAIEAAEKDTGGLAREARVGPDGSRSSRPACTTSWWSTARAAP